MKRIIHKARGRENLLHIETPLGIVNITVGLTASDGADVDSIEILPDDGIMVAPTVCNVRLIKPEEKGG